MRGVVPWISRFLKGKFDVDANPIKSTEFFTTAAYNGLVESMYDLFNSADSAKAVFNPSIPSVSADIKTDNPSPSSDSGAQHNLQDTYLRLDDKFTSPDGYVKVSHVKRSTGLSETSPMRVIYGPGDLSIQNPYAFAAVSLATGNEQYLVVEYIPDESGYARRFSSVIEMVLEYESNSAYASTMEIFQGDVINETTSDGDIERPTRFVVKFGSNKTVGDLISALNAYTYGTTTYFRAALKTVATGTPATSTLLNTLFKYYSDGTPPVLLTTTKVLRFIPPIPSVKIASPGVFLDALFNVTSPGTTGNVLAYTLVDGIKKFINTGTYGFLLRKDYDEAGYLTFPSELVIEDDPALTYIPNKVKSYHYTTTNATPPSWFEAGSPVSNGYLSSVDMDMNYFFIPFVTVSDCTVKFANGFIIHIDDIRDSTLINISMSGSYNPPLWESLVTYDSNTDTSTFHTRMARMFEVFKEHVGFSGADVLTDDESSLLRTSEYYIGLTWFINNVIWIDPAIGALPAADNKDLKIYRDLKTAYDDGVITSKSIIIHIAGKTVQASRTTVDDARFDPDKRIWTNSLPRGVRHLVLDPVTTGEAVVGDYNFTLESAIPGRILFSYDNSVSGFNVIASGQHFEVSEYVGFRILNGDDYDYTTPVTLRHSTFHNLQIEIAKGTATSLLDYRFNAAIDIEDTCNIYKFMHKGVVSVDDFVRPENALSVNYRWYTDLYELRSTCYFIYLGSRSSSNVGSKGRLDMVELDMATDPDYGNDYPSALGVWVDPNYVMDADIHASCLILQAQGRDDIGSEITFTPVFWPYDTSALPPIFSNTGVLTRIVKLMGSYPLNTTLNIRFPNTLPVMAAHGGEKRNKSDITSLIYVESEIPDCNFTVNIYDQEKTWEAPDGSTISDWQSFDPDYFLQNDSLTNVWDDTFMFIDCGLSNTDPMRGGRFLRGNLNIEISSLSVDDGNGYYRFFNSRMFRRSPYIMYMADQHPAFAGDSMRRSEDLSIRFKFNEDNGIVVRSEWLFTPSTGVGYPEIPLSGLSGVDSVYNWMASKVLVSGLMGGSMRIDKLWMVPVQKQLKGLIFPYTPPTPYYNSSINIIENACDFKVNISNLSTAYPDADEWNHFGLIINGWCETKKGFNLSTVSHVDMPELNTNLEIRIGHWLTRAEKSGVIGGRSIKLDINYEFRTQADNAGIEDVGYGTLDTGVFRLPIFPLFAIGGVQGADINFRCSFPQGETSYEGGWPVQKVYSAAAVPFFTPVSTALKETLQTLLELSNTSSINTPTFLEDAANSRLRSIRLLLGNIIPQYNRGDITGYWKILPSTNVSGFVHCTRVSLLWGGYNRLTGYCYRDTSLESFYSISNEVVAMLTADINYTSTSTTDGAMLRFMESVNPGYNSDRREVVSGGTLATLDISPIEPISFINAMDLKAIPVNNSGYPMLDWTVPSTP